jgi:hypothetical protein
LHQNVIAKFEPGERLLGVFKLFHVRTHLEKLKVLVSPRTLVLSRKNAQTRLRVDAESGTPVQLRRLQHPAPDSGVRFVEKARVALEKVTPRFQTGPPAQPE